MTTVAPFAVAYGARTCSPSAASTAFHFHLHVIPRYAGDGYDNGPGEDLAAVDERARWARRLTADGKLSG